MPTSKGVCLIQKYLILNFTLSSSSDNVNDFSGTLKALVDHSFQPAASAEDKEAARLGLEDVFDQLIAILEQNGAEAGVIDKSKTMRSMLYNIYKEARQTSRWNVDYKEESMKNV